MVVGRIVYGQPPHVFPVVRWGDSLASFEEIEEIVFRSRIIRWPKMEPHKCVRCVAKEIFKWYPEGFIAVKKARFSICECGNFSVLRVINCHPGHITYRSMREFRLCGECGRKMSDQMIST